MSEAPIAPGDLDFPEGGKPTREYMPLLMPRLGSRYRNLVLVGTGASACVYRARDIVLEREVAIKILVSAHRDRIRDLLTEARIQARMDCPNICHVYDVGRVGGWQYVALQYVPGGSLERCHVGMTAGARFFLLHEIASALLSIHEKGWIHLDLKPGNVLVHLAESGFPRPYLTDFGMAHRVSRRGFAAATLGTTPFSSPELLNSEWQRVDHRSDIYSLGVLTRFLFPDDSTSSLMHCLDHGGTERVRRCRPPCLPRDSAAGLERIVSRCIEVDPERRYPDAKAFAEDLRELWPSVLVRGIRARAS